MACTYEQQAVEMALPLIGSPAASAWIPEHPRGEGAQATALCPKRGAEVAFTLYACPIIVGAVRRLWHRGYTMRGLKLARCTSTVAPALQLEQLEI
jgi:hypothetical protein